MSYYAYAQGVDNVQPAKTFMDDLKTKIIAVTGWSFIEEVAGTGTRVAQVFKSSGANNSFGSDFYLIVARTSLTSNVGFGVSETYDSSGHTAGKIAPLGGAASTTDQSYATSRNPANENGLVASTTGFIAMAGGASTVTTGMAVPTAGQTFYESITKDRIVIGSASGANEFVYAGLYDSFHASSLDLFPLVLFTGQNTGGGDEALQNLYGATTREVAKVASSAATAGMFGAYIEPLPWPNSFTMMAVPSATETSNVGKEQISGKWFAGRGMVGDSAVRGAMRGLMKSDVLLVPLMEVSEAIGDTMSIDGTAYTFAGKVSCSFVRTGLASVTTVTSGVLVSQAA